MATVYWYGGTGNWSDYANHWSNNSGNSPASNHGAAPGTDDDVVFDANSSSASAAYTVTVDATANCQNFTMAGPGGGNKVTWAGSSLLNVYGNINLTGGTAGITRTYTGAIVMKATSGTKTIDVNGVSLSTLEFSGTGGTFQLTNSLTLVGTGPTLTAGTFDANSQLVSMTSTDSKVIDGNFTGSSSFYSLTVTGSATTGNSLSLKSNITVSNTLTINGDSGINRLLVKSNTLGTARTITAATVTVTNADFKDITGAGAGSWDLSAITGGSGDCGGNTNITFTTADDWYWHVDSGSVSDYTKWYTETNGGGSQMGSTRTPLPQDTLHFDSSSFDSGSRTITQNMPRIGGVTFSGVSTSQAFSLSVATYIYGSLILASGITVSNNQIVFEGGSTYAHTLTANGAPYSCQTTLQKPGSSLTLGSDFTSTAALIIADGTFNTANYNVSVLTFSSATTRARTLTLGSSTITSTQTSGSAILIYNTGNLTTTANTATFKTTGTITDNINVYLDKTNGESLWIANPASSNTVSVKYFDDASITLNDFKINAGRYVKIDDGLDINVTTLTWIGTSTSKINLRGSAAAGWKVSDTTGTNNCEWLDIDYSTAEGGATFNATNSTDGGHNSGWNITAPATATGNFFAVF